MDDFLLLMPEGPVEEIRAGRAERGPEDTYYRNPALKLVDRVAIGPDHSCELKTKGQFAETTAGEVTDTTGDAGHWWLALILSRTTKRYGRPIPARSSLRWY